MRNFKHFAENEKAQRALSQFIADHRQWWGKEEGPFPRGHSDGLSKGLPHWLVSVSPCYNPRVCAAGKEGRRKKKKEREKRGEDLWKKNPPNPQPSLGTKLSQLLLYVAQRQLTGVGQLPEQCRENYSGAKNFDQ